jgi:hypothetical protein
VIPNGFDEADYDEDEAPRTPLSPRFELVYTGTMYESKQDPTPLFDALAALYQAGSIGPANFRLRMVGWYLQEAERQARERGLAELVQTQPAVPRAEAIQLTRHATAQVFFGWTDGTDSGRYSAKVFEYLAAGRPILAVGPGRDVACRLIEESGGVVARTREEVTTVLGRWLAEHQATGTLAAAIDRSRLAPFSRRALTRRLAGVLDSVTGSAALTTRDHDGHLLGCQA